MPFIAVATRVRVGPADLEWTIDVEAIERARILHGWTRRDLAREASVDEGTLSDLLSSKRRPTFATLRAICNPLELVLADVIAFSPERMAKALS
jgi:transcriptional regulator with XRE-family HTH domain